MKAKLQERAPEALAAIARPVIYRLETERISHYFQSCLPDQFDAMIHIDQTSALVALDHHATPALGRPATDPAARV